MLGSQPGNSQNYEVEKLAVTSRLLEHGNQAEWDDLGKSG
jgi:hypothetical protein